MFHTSLHQSLHVHHTFIIVFCNSFTVAKSDNDCIVSSCNINITDSSCSISGDRFSFGTIVYRNTSFDSCNVGSIQCKRNIVKVALQKLYSPFHQFRSIVLCWSDIYIEVCSTCIELLFCSFEDRLRISLCKCFINCWCCCGKSLSNSNKFCHTCVLLYMVFNVSGSFLLPEKNYILCRLMPAYLLRISQAELLL